MSTNPQTIQLTTHPRAVIARTALYLGALAVLATGVVHIQQYYVNDYSTVPTIGTLFFLDFVQGWGGGIGRASCRERVFAVV